MRPHALRVAVHAAGRGEGSSRAMLATARPSCLTFPVGSICGPPATNSCSYSVIGVRSKFGRRAFSVAGPMAWNSLPDTLRDATRLHDSFRRDLKLFFSQFIGPILWGHSGPLCHALSLLSSSSSSWTSMRRRRATVAACDSSNTW